LYSISSEYYLLNLAENFAEIRNLGRLHVGTNMFVVRISGDVRIMRGIIVSEDHLSRLILLMVSISQLYNLFITQENNFVEVK
jgi:hypothetical protein